jgi:hypothetical protein
MNTMKNKKRLRDNYKIMKKRKIESLQREIIKAVIKTIKRECGNLSKDDRERIKGRWEWWIDYILKFYGVKGWEK